MFFEKIQSKLRIILSTPRILKKSLDIAFYIETNRKKGFR